MIIRTNINIMITTFVIFFLSLTGIHAQQKPTDFKVNTVVIDAGHGGRDPGATGKKSVEKDIVLDISLKLGGYIKEHFPDVEVIYTRKKDVFVPLHKRAEIANKNKADLFISVHANASPDKRARGTETYFMGYHKTKENLRVAQKENAAILYEDNYKQEYNGFKPNSTESYIIFSLLQDQYLEESAEYAGFVESQFKERVHRKSRGVKRAGFLVLWRTTMPSVLVETGFISNPREERFLSSNDGRAYIASAIFRAFRNYKKEFEKNNAIYAQTSKENNSDGSKIKPNDKSPISNDSNTQDNAIENNFTTTNKTNNNATPKEESKESDGLKSNSDVTYKVQILSSPKSLPLDAHYFKGVQNVEKMKVSDEYKYLVGSASSYENILSLKKEIRKNFPGAFVVALKDGAFISVKQALKQTE